MIDNPEALGEPRFKTGLEYQRFDDIQFEEIEDESSADFVIRVTPEAPPTEIREKVRSEIAEHNWWMSQEWRQKGLPKEQFEVRVGERTLDVYNFGQSLNQTQIAELSDAWGIISNSLAVNKAAAAKYLLINNEPTTNIKTGEDLSGLSEPKLKAIILYPRALNQKQHRIPEVSNFEGTILHETAHVIQDADNDFKQQWIKDFGWQYNDDTAAWTNIRPEAVPNSYARFNPDEDICDSFAATAKNPGSIDQDRAEFVRNRWLGENTQSIAATINKKVDSAIQLPLVKKIKYKLIRRSKPSFKIK